MFNLVAVALLIQHVACVATASVHVTGEATTSTTLVSSKALTDPLPSAFVPTALLLRRHGDNGSSSSYKNSPTQSDSGSRATSRHLSAIESRVGGVSSIVAGDDGVDFAAYVNGESHANPCKFTYIRVQAKYKQYHIYTSKSVVANLAFSVDFW